MGSQPSRILWRHVLPNAGAVIVNVVALNAIFLLSGVIVIENVFAYPGIGTLMVQAIQAKDLPIVEAVAVVSPPSSSLSISLRTGSSYSPCPDCAPVGRGR